MSLTKDEKKQYDRHLILNEIGLEGQLKLKSSKVLVIGAGGLGCPILQYLTAAGVGTIGIVDDDVIDQSNLQRQILYSFDDIGEFKATKAVDRLKTLNPFSKFNTYLDRLTSDNAIQLFDQYDIIVDGTDNFSTRYLVNDAAVLSNKPVVFGSIFKFEGQVSVFNFNNGPTYRCLYPIPPKPNEVPNCSELGVLGVLPGIIGSFQANEVVKIICGIGTVLSGKLLTFNSLLMQQSIFSLQKNHHVQITELNRDYELFCGLTPSVSEISLLSLRENLASYNLLDVRRIEEREQNNIGGCHIPLHELMGRIHEIRIDKPLVVYCKAGVRSKMAIDILTEENLNVKLINLSSGIGV